MVPKEQQLEIEQRKKELEALQASHEEVARDLARGDRDAIKQAIEPLSR